MVHFDSVSMIQEDKLHKQFHNKFLRTMFYVIIKCYNFVKYSTKYHGYALMTFLKS